MLRTTLLAVLVGMGVLAGAASAATVETDGDTVTYKGGEGRDWPNASSAGGKLAISDSVNGFSAVEAPCTQVDESTVECPMPARYRAELGGGSDDHAFGTDSGALPATLAIELHGQGGDDRLEPWDPSDGTPIGGTRLADGGEGNDTLYGSTGVDQLLGGAGNDIVFGYGGADQLQGGEGDDTMSGEQGHPQLNVASSFAADVVDGGPGTDKLSDYDNPTTATVSVTLDAQANDGRSGENDNLISLEDIQAQAGGTWSLSEGDESLEVYGGDGRTTVLGLGGNDRLWGAQDVDEIDGGAGDDRVEGGLGDDTLTGGPGRDAIFGDSTRAQCGGNGQSCTVPFGNDTIHARDGEVDSIDCGVGTDRAVVDAADVVAANCETVERPAEQQQQQQQQQGVPACNGAASSSGACVDDLEDLSPSCTVPKVARLKQAVAIRKVRVAGCKAKVKRVRHRKVKKGRAIRTAPGAAKVLTGGTTVTVYVSKGRR